MVLTQHPTLPHFEAIGRRRLRWRGAIAAVAGLIGAPGAFAISCPREVGPLITVAEANGWTQRGELKARTSLQYVNLIEGPLDGINELPPAIQVPEVADGVVSWRLHGYLPKVDVWLVCGYQSGTWLIRRLPDGTKQCIGGRETRGRDGKKTLVPESKCE